MPKNTSVAFCVLGAVLLMMYNEKKVMKTIEDAHEAANSAALNAADEIAVNAFLNGEILFTDIPKIVAGVLDKHKSENKPLTLTGAAMVDEWARDEAEDLLKSERYKNIVL